MDRLDGYAQIVHLAASQHGFVTRAQAIELGLHDTALNRLAGDMRLVHSDVFGVWRTVGAADFAHAPVYATWLALQPTVSAFDRLRTQPTIVVKGATAAMVQGLGDLDGYPVEVWIPPGVRPPRRRDTRAFRREVPAGEWHVVNGIPVTTPAVTIRDLIVDGHDMEHVVAVAADARQAGLTATELAGGLNSSATARYNQAANTRLTRDGVARRLLR